jgi:hypothetical protein
MNLQVSVAELIEAFGRTYKSIDVRIAAMKEKDSWVNLFTVVRLSYEGHNATAARLELLEQRFLRIRTEHFRIDLVTLPFSQWETFCLDVSSGVVHANEESIRLLSPIVLREQKGCVSWHATGFKYADSHPWPSLTVSRTTQDRAKFYDSTVNKELSAIGYSSPNEAIDHVFEAANIHQDAFNCDFFLFVPVFAFISKIWISQSRKRIYVSVVRHNEVSGLRIALSFHGRDSAHGLTPKGRHVLDRFGSPMSDASVFEETVDAEIPDLLPEDNVQAALLSSAVGELWSTSDWVSRLVPPAQRNLLLEALKRFCPEDKFEQLVCSPHTIEPSNLKESAAFERTVAWLLGLFGYLTISLGEFEYLSAPGRKVRLGSVDILAKVPSGETLLLVSCTLGVPKEEDFANLVNMQAILADELLPETTYRILPILFTGARYGLSAASEGPAGSVRIVDAEGMEKMLGLLRNGGEQWFFEFLNNPTFVIL